MRVIISLAPKRFLIFVVVLAGLAVCASGQTPTVLISAGSHISTDSPNNPFVETFVAINPRDPKNLISTSMVGAEGQICTRIYFSQDGGKTWRRAQDRTDTIPGGDPTVYFDSEGTGFFGLNAAPGGFLISRSTDGGMTWDPPVTVPGGTYDRPYVAFDNSSGKFRGRLYAGGTIGVYDATGKRHLAVAISYSVDHGRTFSSPRIVTGNWQGEDVGEIADLVVTPDGKLVVCFEGSARSGPGSEPDEGHFWLMVSDDGSLTFSKALQGPSFKEGEGLQLLKSESAPRATMDMSNGPYRGRYYLAWADFDGQGYVIKVAHTEDLGQTWSSAAKVNDNQTSGDPANPAITVAGNGIVGIVFNDRRDDPESTCFKLYASASVDGGDSFLPNVAASRKPSCPLAAGNWAAMASSWVPPASSSGPIRRPVLSMSVVGTRWPNGGDTQGLIASPDNVFHAAWINGESGVLQLWSTELTVSAQLVNTRLSSAREDLSRDLQLKTSNAIIDLKEHTVSMRARLANPTPLLIHGPFTVVVYDLGGSLTGLTVANSDNGIESKGAEWTFAVGGKKDSPILKPDQDSDERILSWKFKNGPTSEAIVPLFTHFTIRGARLDRR